jgi:hypothetical protein
MIGSALTRKAQANDARNRGERNSLFLICAIIPHRHSLRPPQLQGLSDYLVDWPFEFRVIWRFGAFQLNLCAGIERKTRIWVPAPAPESALLNPSLPSRHK